MKIKIKKYGAAWVRFTATPTVARKVREYCAKPGNCERNKLNELPDGTLLWYHPANSRGEGTRDGNCSSDFLRIAASAVLGEGVSVARLSDEHKFKTGKAWNFREWIRPWVDIHAYDWIDMSPDVDTDVAQKVYKIYGKINVDLVVVVQQ